MIILLLDKTPQSMIRDRYKQKICLRITRIDSRAIIKFSEEMNMFFYSNAIWGLLFLLIGFVLLSIAVDLLIKIRNKRIRQEKGTCLSCRHLSYYASYPSEYRTCWNKMSTWHFHIASKAFWKRMRQACNYYEEKNRK